MKDAAFEEAVREVFGRPLRIKITIGDAASRGPRRADATPKADDEDEVTGVARWPTRKFSASAKSSAAKSAKFAISRSR